jgi:phospholipid/cholesterol/gamma-HCH transport system permease protein
MRPAEASVTQGLKDPKAEPKPGWARVRQGTEGAVLELGGSWTTETAGELDAELRRLAAGPAKIARIDLGAVGAFDTAGALLVRRLQRELAERGLTVALTGAKPSQASLIETVARHETPLPLPPARLAYVLVVLERIGRATMIALSTGRDLLNFLGLSVVTGLRALRHAGRFRPASLVSHMEQTGLDALPILGLLSFLIGVVTAYQGIDQLARFGAQIFTVNIVGIGILREMGILITAIIVAGRSGSAFTAQIGTMKVNEEVDAMRTIGLDPIEVLVLPRLLALVLVMPLLTFFADMMGILGGAVMSSVSLDISLVQFARHLRTAVSISSLWVGLIKAPLFGFVIALVGCFEGLRVSYSAESVGQRTTAAVVESVFLVIVLDAILSIFFSAVNM